MWKIPDYLNIFESIRKYIMIKKLEKYSGNNDTKVFWINIVDVLIACIAIVALYYIYFRSGSHNLKLVTSGIIAISIISYIIKISKFVREHARQHEGITKLILIEGEEICKTEWEIQGKKSLLIGKSTKTSEVDIDLSNVEYASLVSKQHAVMNFAGNSWYIEDIGSYNGVGIKKINDTSKIKLEKDVPYKLDSGDIIYIANTKLFVK